MEGLRGIQTGNQATRERYFGSVTCGLLYSLLTLTDCGPLGGSYNVSPQSGLGWKPTTISRRKAAKVSSIGAVNDSVDGESRSHEPPKSEQRRETEVDTAYIDQQVSNSTQSSKSPKESPVGAEGLLGLIDSVPGVEDDPASQFFSADTTYDDATTEITTFSWKPTLDSQTSVARYEDSFPQFGPHPLPLIHLYDQPHFESNTPEMISLFFHQRTCDILSITEDPSNHPWRTLMWPLAKDSPGLYHAIAAMTCLHMSKVQPRLRAEGIAHVQSSIQSIIADIDTGNISIDAAIAASLALGFAEAWDHQLSLTGCEHIKGAKLLIQQAINKHQTVVRSTEELLRLKFLAKTWLYTAVIARFTSVNGGDLTDFELMDNCIRSEILFKELQLDPLMGCAVTLFPTIGRVADLVARVWHRNAKRNSPAITSEAAALKADVERWVPTIDLQASNEPASNVSDSIQTAEAYRWAVLILLRQAVPELPFANSIWDMVQKVLVYLATIPLSSRTTILHLFPLMVAGAEAFDKEDRDWVRERWKLMSWRMITGIVDRCILVTEEVWRRRDECENLNLNRSRHLCDADPLLSAKSVSDGTVLGAEAPIDPDDLDATANETEDIDYSVNGKLHWIAVMVDWKWQGMWLFSASQSHLSKRY